MIRVQHYKLYHLAMQVIGDIDPSYPALEYIADRFELNIEQRYWLAFLYQSCYTASAVFYIYNEFPDYENVDVGRLQKWWEENKHRLFFQTDRAKVKNFNVFVPMFESYRELVGESQQGFFESMIGDSKLQTYKKLYKVCGGVYYVGRFSLFQWLESMHRLTNLSMYPDTLDLRNAESCRNGLLYALGLNGWIGRKLRKQQYDFLTSELDEIVEELNEEYTLPVDHWCVETSLCSYKKLYWGKRYLGYYIDRMQDEIIEMQDNVPDGVCWDVLWDFRKEFFNEEWLGEVQGWVGVRKEMMGLPSKKLLSKALNQSYIRKVEFGGVTDARN